MTDAKTSVSTPTASTPPAEAGSRRGFLKTGLAVGGAVALTGRVVAQESTPTPHSYGSDVIKIGLIGCGGRGTQAAMQAMSTEGPVHLVSMADVFEDRLQASFRGIKGRHADKVDVSKETMFSGLDGWKKVLETDIDLVILATPPGFRPLHFEAAVKAGKHVFMEKPVATDAPGCRRVLEANELAKKKGLAVAVGLQRHHERAYEETIARLQDGAIGDIILARAYWNGDRPWVRPRQEGQTELEYQLRNWYYFNWIGGDHIVEQHIHNIDVINWLMNDYPVEAQGQGGQEVHTGVDRGEIFDHHFVEFTYKNGTKMLSQCRHMPGCWNAVGEYAHGTKGYANIGDGEIYDASGKQVFKSRGARGGHQQEHHDLFKLLRAGEIPNEGDLGAKSTFTAIFGRMATYSGKVLKWDDALKNGRELANFDTMTSFDGEAPVQPIEQGGKLVYATPVPGKTNVMA